MIIDMGKKLSQRQKNIITGSVLGDGYLEFDGYKGTRLQIKQSKRYKEYVFWLYKELHELCKSAPKRKKNTGQWYFSTRYKKELTDLRNKFYSKGKKIIPLDIAEILKSGLSLAIWYLDDGTMDYREKDHRSFTLATNCFTNKEVERLIDVLHKNFRIIATLQTTTCRGKKYPRIYVGKMGRDKFLRIIKPYILSCFSHKYHN